MAPVKKGTITAATATGSQATTGVGFQPRAILFWVTNQTAEGYAGGIGFSVGSATRQGGTTQQWSQAIGADDAVSTSNTGRGSDDAACIHILQGGAQTVDASATLTSFDSDGFTLNWANAAGSAWIIHYLAFDQAVFTDAYAGSLVTTAGTSNQGVTAPGFTPDVLFGISDLQGLWEDALTQANMTMGVARTSTERAAIAWRSRDAQADEDLVSSLISTKWLRGISSTSSAEALTVDLVSMDANGFTFVQSAAIAIAFGYLALKGGTHKVGVDTVKTTSTGTKATTGVGFTPSGLLLLSRGLASSTSVGTADDANLMMGATDGTAEGLTCISADDAAATMAVDSRTVTSKVLANQSVTPATLREADLSSFDSDGFTLSYTTVDAVAAEFIYWAIGGSTSHEGASTTNLTFGSTTAGKRNRKAATAAAFTFASTTSGRRTAIAAAAAALAFGSSTAGVRRVLGAASTSITFGSTTAGKRLAVGAATTILTFGSTTAGKRNRKAATTTVLTFTSTTEAVLHGAATTILTFGSTTAGVRTTFGESLAAFLFGSTTTISQAHSPVDGLGHMRRGSMIRYGLESRSARARSLDDD